MKKKKSEKRTQKKRKNDAGRSYSSPVCYADSPEVHPEYRIEAEKEQPPSKDDESGK